MARRRRGLRLLTLTLARALATPAPPARADDDEREPPATKRVEAVSRWVYEGLTEAQEAMEAENWSEARARLEELLEGPELNSHEEALVRNSLGYVHSGQERYGQAIASFQEALALEGLPESAQLNTQYNLGQLLMMTEQYEEGIEVLESWFAEAKNPAASAYILLANAHAQREDYEEAWRWAEQGLAKMQDPRENWMRLGAQLNLQLENYDTARRWLERLVERWPRKSYWMQLVAVYGQKDQQRKALVAMEMAHRQGFLDESSELVRLAQLYLYNELPYEAAVLLEQGLEDGSIEGDADNWEMLANAWSNAREYDRAVTPLRKAARLSKDSDLWLRLGQLHLDAERWAKAESALREALAAGNLDDPGQARIMLGISLFQRDYLEKARSVFERARAHGGISSQAEQWLEVIAARSPRAAEAAPQPPDASQAP